MDIENLKEHNKTESEKNIYSFKSYLMKHKKILLIFLVLAIVITLFSFIIPQNIISDNPIGPPYSKITRGLPFRYYIEPYNLPANIIGLSSVSEIDFLLLAIDIVFWLLLLFSMRKFVKMQGYKYVAISVILAPLLVLLNVNLSNHTTSGFPFPFNNPYYSSQLIYPGAMDLFVYNILIWATILIIFFAAYPYLRNLFKSKFFKGVVLITLIYFIISLTYSGCMGVVCYDVDEGIIEGGGFWDSSGTDVLISLLSIIFIPIVLFVFIPTVIRHLIKGPIKNNINEPKNYPKNISIG